MFELHCLTHERTNMICDITTGLADNGGSILNLQECDVEIYYFHIAYTDFFREVRNMLHLFFLNEQCILIYSWFFI